MPQWPPVLAERTVDKLNEVKFGYAYAREPSRAKPSHFEPLQPLWKPTSIDSTMSRSPSAYASRSLASSWVPESPRDEPTPLSYVLETSSPQRSSSHDKYVPSCENTPEYVSAISSSSALYSTPSHRSSAVGISPGTREALKTFYEHVYGADSKRCLVTGKTEPLIAAHVVQRASKAEQVMQLYF